MKYVKKVFLTIVNALSVAIIVLAVLMLLTVVMTKAGKAPDFMGYSVFRVLTGSMEPNLPVNSLIIVKKTDPSLIRENDIITFYSTDPGLMGAINTHRVVEVTEENGEKAFITKGDANQIADKYVTLSRNLIGKVIFKSVVLGVIVRLVSNPIVFIPLIILPLVILLVSNIVKTVRVSKEMINEEIDGNKEDDRGGEEEKK